MEILIVEDELGIMQFLQQGLEEEGFIVTTASDGLIGLDLAQKGHFDLLLLDWMLPKMSGLDLCKTFRMTNKGTPILFLTAKDTTQETIQGLQAGGNDYIKKPFDFSELLERINIHFRNKKIETRLHLGEIIINIDEYTVTNCGQEVGLTQREFELLKFLVLNKGKVCTRKQIIEEVWDIHFNYDTGVIDVFINAIRKKLKLKVEQDYIKTIRGVGYMVSDLT
ncbi:response regulator transcription factor [Flavobacterium sp. 7A]|uniref:response regulator transcription factor n=1 Tax=Flavobacterium sp. 7A TaxID=2940571 RepID=UPI00222775C4|nr:response regulator transcription factor [Flavobacterium sp. 7A]MCW2120040.1 DNA-binding response OmpR family regulator [Flavobacterium sp. 7A]